MKKNTLRNGFLGSKCGTRCSFKGFVMFVVMMLMTANSAMAEVIDGLRYMLDSETKTATLMQKTTGFYFGNIIVPEKVKDNDGVVYVVTALGKHCFDSCNGLTSITIPSSVTYFFAAAPFRLAPHALKGQKLLAQGNTLGINEI